MKGSVRLDPSDIDPLAVLIQADQRKAAEEEKRDQVNLLDHASLADAFLISCKIKPIDLRSVHNSVSGMQLYAKAKDWKNVTLLANTVLKDKSGLEYGVCGEETRLLASPALCLRLEGHFRLKMFDEILEEINNVLVSPAHPLPNPPLKSLLMIPGVGLFSNPKYQGILTQLELGTGLMLAVLHSEVRLLTGGGDEGSEQLFALKTYLNSTVDKISSIQDYRSSLIKQKWYWHVSFALVNAACRQKQWRLAVTLMEGCGKDIVSLWTLWRKIGNEDKKNALAERIRGADCILRCRLTRLFLQIGNIEVATRCLAEAIAVLHRQTDPSVQSFGVGVISTQEALTTIAQFDFKQNLSSSPSLRAALSNLCVTIALLHYSKGEFLKALNGFYDVFNEEKSASTMKSDAVEDIFSKNPVKMEIPNNITLEEEFLEYFIAISTNAILRSHATEGGDAGDIAMFNNTNECLLSVTANNYALCALNVKRIQDAVGMLEDLIFLNPSRFLIDPVVFNLCTMYDLLYAPELSTSKKKALQIVAAQYYIENPVLHWRCFRLQGN